MGFKARSPLNIKTLAPNKMTCGLTRLLVECGALSPRQPGPPKPLSAEEAKQRKEELQAAAVKRRRDLIRAARENGEQDPVFKKGRPRKYTPEEANAKKRSGGQVHNDRLKQGLKNFAAMVAKQHEQSTSNL